MGKFIQLKLLVLQQKNCKGIQKKPCNHSNTGRMNTMNIHTNLDEKGVDKLIQTRHTSKEIPTNEKAGTHTQKYHKDVVYNLMNLHI